MEGLFFYLAAWCTWVYVLLISDSKGRKVGLPFVLLALIILAPIKAVAGNISIFAGGVFILICIAFLLMKERKKQAAYFYISSFIVALAYSASQFYSLFDPVIFFAKKEWLIAALISIIIILLQNSMKWRIMAALFGTLQGEILAVLVMAKFSFPFEAGGMVYLDHAALILCFIFCWNCLEKAANWLNMITKPGERSKKITHE